MLELTSASKTRLNTTHLWARLSPVSHQPSDLELQESWIRLKTSFDGLKQESFQMELFIAKHMQVYKDLVDLSYTLDDLGSSMPRPIIHFRPL